MTIFGTAGNDNLSGTGGGDTFDLTQGGNDTAQGLGGNDAFLFAGTFTKKDHVFGGAGLHDRLGLAGTYDLAFTFTSEQINGIEEISLFGEDIYRLRFADSAVADGATMLIDGSGLGESGVFSVDARQETDGNYTVKGGAGDDLIQTGGGDDAVFGGDGDNTIEMRQGHDKAVGGAGTDTFHFVGNGALDASDRIDGGVGGTIDEVTLDGNYSGGLVLGANTLVNIEKMSVLAGHDYDIDLRQAQHLDDGPAFQVFGTDLGSGDVLHVTAAGSTGYVRLDLIGGAANDILTGGNHENNFTGGLGADRMTCGKAQDTFNYTSADRGQPFDTIVGFDTADDQFLIFGILTAQAIDPAVKRGFLSAASFDHDIEHALGAAKLGDDDAVLFRAKRGDLAGVWFLAIDGNSTAGFQADADFIVRLDDPQHLSGLTTSNILSIV